MPVHEQHESGVTITIPADLTGGAEQALYLGGCQVLAGPPSLVLRFRGRQLCRKEWVGHCGSFAWNPHGSRWLRYRLCRKQPFSAKLGGEVIEGWVNYQAL